MKIYIVLDKNGRKVGSRNKKFFTNKGHIKTAELDNKINMGEYILEEYDLDNIKPNIIKKL